MPVLATFVATIVAPAPGTCLMNTCSFIPSSTQQQKNLSPLCVLDIVLGAENTAIKKRKKKKQAKILGPMELIF